MAYTLTVNYDNPPVAVMTLTSDTTFSTAYLCRFKVYSDDAGTQLVSGSGWFTPEEGSLTISYTFSSLSFGTYYVTVESDQPQTFVSLQEVVLADNTPRTATQAQWEDLTARIKAKADSTSIPTVNNSTITVTNNGTSKGAFTTNQASAGSVALDYPVITMTTTDPGEGSALAENNYIGVYGGDPIIMDYSINEVNTGAKWIDGSVIYKKTINFGSLPNNTSKQVAHNIASLDRIIKIDGIMNDSNDSHFWTIPYVAVNNIEVFSGNIQITTTLDLTSYTAYITLYYTKSS